MQVKYTVGRNEYQKMSTQELRNNFLIDSLFQSDEVQLVYCEVERSIVGSAVPVHTPLKLESAKELAASYFCERRELGILNIGGHGVISVDNTEFKLEPLDALYIGKGAQEIILTSIDAETPAKFYLVSYPAHAVHITSKISRSNATKVKLGCQETANKRTIYQYIHESGVQSCQLVLGYTELEPGSVWNTMPAHTHERRSEVYMYFGLATDSTVFHLMGPKNETRHIAMQEGNAIFSPIWSIHSGCGTQAYKFCWAMGGENKAFDDMDKIAISDLK